MLKNEIWCGDCLELMNGIPDSSVDMVLCDLPYGTTACKWDVIIPFDELWRQYNRITKDSSPIILFGAQPFTSLLVTSNLKDYRYDWYWEKEKAANFLFGNKMPLKVIETVSVFYQKQPVYNPQKRDNPNKNYKRTINNNIEWKKQLSEEMMNNMPKQIKAGKNYEEDKLLPKTLIKFAKDQRNKLHPTQKPVALMEYFIKTYSNEGDLILDNCAGSGSTLLAAKNLNRQFIGIEKEEKYHNICVERLK